VIVAMRLVEYNASFIVFEPYCRTGGLGSNHTSVDQSIDQVIPAKVGSCGGVREDLVKNSFAVLLD
jgi:hypothetical protein